MKEQKNSNNEKVILIQGAMDIEIEYIVNLLKDKNFIKIGDYEFYEGNFKPNIVINQGIAGAHQENLHIGDIIIGEKCCNINSYKMPIKNREEGSNPFEWELSKRAKEVQYADKKLVNIIENSIRHKSDKKVCRGTLGSGDVFNREYDRIIWLNKTFGNLCEDMESIGTYSVCNKFNISCIGIRIISNNELLLEELDKNQALILQKILINILDDITN